MLRAVPLGRTVCALLLLGALLLPAGVAAAPRKAAFRPHTEQGVHYYRKRKLEAAREALEQAMKLPGGSSDHETLYTLARVYYDLQMLEKAIPTAKRCTEVIEGGEGLEDCQQLLRSLIDGFGELRLLPAQDSPEQRVGRVELETRSELIHPKKKKIFEGIAERLAAAPVELPLSLYLPFGSYAANGVPFTLERGDKAVDVKLLLPPPKLAAAQPVEKKKTSPWWYVGATALAVGAGATAAVLLLGGEEQPQPQPLELGEIRLLDPER